MLLRVQSLPCVHLNTISHHKLADLVCGGHVLLKKRDKLVHCWKQMDGSQWDQTITLRFPKWKSWSLIRWERRKWCSLTVRKLMFYVNISSTFFPSSSQVAYHYNKFRGSFFGVWDGCWKPEIRSVQSINILLCLLWKYTSAEVMRRAVDCVSEQSLV